MTNKKLVRCNKADTCGQIFCLHAEPHKIQSVYLYENGPERTLCDKPSYCATLEANMKCIPYKEKAK